MSFDFSIRSLLAVTTTTTILFLVVISVAPLVRLTTAEVDHIPCNNQRCQSRVSFCLLTKECACEDFEANFTCANLCTKCLNDTYQDCCSCVGLCKASVKEADITKLSNVEILSEPDTEVFKLISLAPAKPQDWHSQTLSFKLLLDLDLGGLSSQLPADAANQTQTLTLNSTPEFNCTVVYLAQCMAMNKCKQNCNSMGASAFRWFHNACCECIGECDAAPFGDEEAKCEFCRGDIIGGGGGDEEESPAQLKSPEDEGIQGDEAARSNFEEEGQEEEEMTGDDADL